MTPVRREAGAPGAAWVAEQRPVPLMAPDRARLWDRFLPTWEPTVRAELIDAHLPLVRWVSSRVPPLGPDMFERESLVGSGVFGLADAIERFVPSTGTRFETFAVLRIRGAILDALRALEWAPRSVRQLDDELFCIVADLATRLKRSPTTDELLAETGISRGALASMRAGAARSRLGSLDHRSGGAEIPAVVGRGQQGAGNAGDPAHTEGSASSSSARSPRSASGNVWSRVTTTSTISR